MPHNLIEALVAMNKDRAHQARRAVFIEARHSYSHAFVDNSLSSDGA